MSHPRILLVGSANRHKIAELESLLAGLADHILSTNDLPEGPGVAEDGDTFAANAAIKALEYARRATALPPGRRPRWVLADDSGLAVDALGGAPGVHSARFAGPGASDPDNVAKLLGALAGVPDGARGARFVCAIALATVPGGAGDGDPGAPPRVVLEVAGECAGSIGHAPRGSGGFGYDPVFIDDVTGLTFAELSAAQKHARSHRGRALALFRERFESLAADG